MRTSLSHAASFVSALLSVAAVAFRLRDTPETTMRTDVAPPVHIGIDGPDGVSGLVSARKSDVLNRAESELHLPVGCLETVRPSNLFDGARLRFERRGDRCVLAGIGALNGAARLMSGLPLDINGEDEIGLTFLPGIGPVKARAIVESRERDGPFRDADDLTRVHGIGTKTALKIRPWVDFKNDQSGSK